MTSTLLPTERIVSSNGRRLIQDAFDTLYVVYRDNAKLSIQLADAKAGENLYDTDSNDFIGYCPDAFDADYGRGVKFGIIN